LIKIREANPCAKEFGKLVMWWIDRWGNRNPGGGEVVAALVQEGKFLWLDWAAEYTPFVIRTEKKRRAITKDDLWLDYEVDGSARLMARTKGNNMKTLLVFHSNGVVTRIGSADNAVVNTENGMMKFA
ncbi:MAG: hypothetical protein WC423_20125, partial [Vulcanimicrobiota bacterium]